MRFLILVSYIFFTLLMNSFSNAQTIVLNNEAQKEFAALIEKSSNTRKYLYCALIAQNLGMNDLKGLFLRKLTEHTKNSNALLVSLFYMKGFLDSETMHMGDDAGTILGAISSKDCLPVVLGKE